MTARVHLDSRSVEQTSSGAIVGRIWIEICDAAFPEVGWFDFPVPILTWWIEAVRDLIHQGSDEASIRFMDGPFEIRLQKVGQAFVATFLRSGSPTMPPSEMDAEQFLASALECAETLSATLGGQGVKSTDLDDLARLAKGTD